MWPKPGSASEAVAAVSHGLAVVNALKWSVPDPAESPLQKGCVLGELGLGGVSGVQVLT